MATPVTHGVPFTVKATATDTAGNLLAGYSAAASWSDLSGSIQPANPAAFTHGVSTTSATVAQPFPSDRVTVMSGGVPGKSSYFTVG